MKFAWLNLPTVPSLETSGVIDHQSRRFLKELGHHTKLITSYARSTVFLLYTTSFFTVQRVNAASVLGSINTSEDFEL